MRDKARITVYQPDLPVIAHSKTTGEILEGPWCAVIRYVSDWIAREEEFTVTLDARRLR